MKRRSKVVKSIRKDVVFVRNPHYQETSNTYSVSLATKGLKHPYIIIDGDLLINKKSFSKFVKSFDGKNSLIGIANASTDDAVYVELDHDDKVIQFNRNKKNKYEWSGIVCLNNIIINDKDSYVYQILEKHLPLQAKYI